MTLTNILRVLIALIGGAALLLAARLWWMPDVAAADFGLQAINPVGIATLRADVAGYFIAAGLLLLWAAWRRAAWALTPVLVLLGAALAGRTIGLLLDGNAPGVTTPMLIEVVLIAIVWAARQNFAARR